MNFESFRAVRPRWICVALLGICLLVAKPLVARDLYVDNQSGDDGRDGLSADSRGDSGPLRTIRRALKLAGKGDRIIVANTGEPYRESVTLQAGPHSGITNHPFTILGNGAILDGSQSVPAEVWQHVQDDIFRFQPPRMAHQILYLDGKPAERVVTPPSGELPALKPLQWCLLDRQIYFRTQPEREPAAYNLAYAALPVGITIYEARNVVIRGLTVQGYQLDGVNAHDGAFNLTLAGMVCRGNGRSGISIGGASRVRIEACLVGNNGEAQLRTEGFSHTRLVNCDLIDDNPAAPALVRESGEVIVEKAPEGAAAAGDS